MNNLITLVKMQLREKLNFGHKSAKDKTFFNVVFPIFTEVLKFALIALLCAAFIMVAQMFDLFKYNNKIPLPAMAFVFVAMTGMSIISCTVGLTKALYYSRDNAILLTLPCVPMQIFLSKIIIFLIYELKRGLSFIVPLFTAYFFLNGFGIHYYLWMLLCFFIVSVFVVSLGALLSIPGMWLANVFNQHKLLQRVCLVLIVGISVLALVFAISLIPENIDIPEQSDIIKNAIRGFVDRFAYENPAAIVKEYRLLYDVSSVIIGGGVMGKFLLLDNLRRLGILLVITAVLVAISLVIVRPLFYKMASKPFEYLKKKTKEKANRCVNKKVTGFVHEMRIALKTSERMYSNVGILIAIPILIFLLNKIFAAMNVRDVGEFMILGTNILVILLIALNANTYAASIFSRDGRSSYLIKTQPTKPFGLLVAKLLPNTIFVTLSFIISFFVVKDLCRLSTLDSLYLIAGLWFVYLTHLLFSAELDIMNPQIEIYATVGNNDSNPNENKATAIAFFASFAVAAFIFFLLTKREGSVTFLKLMLVSMAAFAYKAFVFYQNIKLYYKEK